MTSLLPAVAGAATFGHCRLVAPGSAAQRRTELEPEAMQRCFNWVLTGETACLDRARPTAPLLPGNPRWTGHNQVARCSRLQLDGDKFGAGADPLFDPACAAADAEGHPWGVNGYFNCSINWVPDYERTGLRSGAQEDGDSDVQEARPGRLQVAF